MFKRMFTSTAVNREIVVKFQTLIASKASDARFTLALASLSVAILGIYRAQQIAPTVTTSSLNIAITVLETKR